MQTDLSFELTDLPISESTVDSEDITELIIGTNFRQFKMFVPFRKLRFQCVTVSEEEQQDFDSRTSKNENSLQNILKRNASSYAFSAPALSADFQKLYDQDEAQLDPNISAHLLILQYRYALDNLFSYIGQYRNLEFFVTNQQDTVYIHHSRQTFFTDGTTKILQEVSQALGLRNDESRSITFANDQGTYVEKLLHYMKYEFPLMSNEAYRLPTVVSNREFLFSQKVFPILDGQLGVSGVFYAEHLQRLIEKFSTMESQLSTVDMDTEVFSVQEAMEAKNLMLQHFSLEQKKLARLRGLVQKIKIDVREEKIRIWVR